MFLFIFVGGKRYDEQQDQMHYAYSEPVTGARFTLHRGTPQIKQAYGKPEDKTLLTIAWNRGKDTLVEIDGVEYQAAENQFLSLMYTQSFSIGDASDFVVWQFNREFYCVIDHDKEVSCAGLLFHGALGNIFLTLSDDQIQKMELLYQVFLDEFGTQDNIQGEMLRMLLKRLIIKLTRITKSQYLEDLAEQSELDVVRQYNLLVEQHFREYHKVQEYAKMLHKSPKTLSNLFTRSKHKSPLRIIKDRIVLEAKRLLIYSDKSISEIAYDLGFEEVPHFIRLFKTHTGTPPGQFKSRLMHHLGKN